MPLELVTEERIPHPGELSASRLTTQHDSPLVAAATAHFEAAARRRAQEPLPPLPLFRDVTSGLLRTVYKEIVVRFAAGVTERTRRAIIAKYDLSVQRAAPLVAGQRCLEDQPRRSVGGGGCDRRRGGPW